MEELLGDDVDEDDVEMMKLLMKQKAPEKVVVEALARMRDLWMSEIVSDFFTRMAEGDKPPPVIYCHLVAQAVRAHAVCCVLCGMCDVCCVVCVMCL